MNDDPVTSPNGPPKKPTEPPPRPLSALEKPIILGPLDKPIDLAAWGGFFSITGGSILYCLSAMCVIYGIATVLGPIFARSYVFGETVPCLIALNVYELALLVVLVVIVVWQDVTDDAISLVVLAAVFLAVSGIALTTTSNSRPGWVSIIGLCSFALAMGKVFVLRRFIRMSISPILWGGLAVVLGWNFLAGSSLADAAVTRTVSREQWLFGWLVLLAGGVTVLVDAVLRRPTPLDASGARVPFLRRPAMSWIFSLVLLVATGVHQAALADVFSVPADVIDYLPLVSILSLILMQLSLHLRSKPDYLEAALAAVPLGAFLVALAEDPVLAGPAFGVRLLWYPPVFLALTGGAVLVAGLRRKCRPILAVAPFYALAVVLTSTVAAASPEDLHWHLTAALLVAGLFGVGLVRRNEALCVVAVLVGTAGFAGTESFEGFSRWLGVAEASGLLGLAGVGTLVVALLLGRMSPALLVLSAVAVMICAFDFLPSALGMRDLYVALALLLLVVGLWMRLRHRPSIVVLCVPIGWRLAVAFHRLTSWRYVILGFVLLFAGAWVSIRKGKRARREAAAAEPAKAEETDEADAGEEDIT